MSDASRNLPPEHADVVLRILRGEVSIPDAARDRELSVAAVTRWIEDLMSAGRVALRDPAVVEHRRTTNGDAANGQASTPAQKTGAAFAQAVQQWLKLLPEPAQGTSWAVDRDLRFTMMYGIEPFIGESAESVIGTTLYDLLETDDPTTDPIAHHLEALEGREGSYETEWAGRIFVYRLLPLRGADGSIEGVIGASLDVTEGKLSEAALHNQSESFRFVLDQLPVIFWTADRELKITSAMGQGLAPLGQNGKELVGVSVLDYLDVPGTGHQLIHKHHEALAGRPGSLTGQWSGRDYECLVQPLRNMVNEVIGVAGLSIDVSERAAVERKRDEVLQREQAAREQAEINSRMKDEFLATVSHELRTPLNAILGWAHLLREDSLDPPTRARALETIERNSLAQVRLIQDLLDVSSIVSGRTRLDVSEVTELPSIVTAVLDSLRPAAMAKSVALEHAFDPHAGAILGDPERLQQIVWNLVSNAIKFTPPGGCVWVTLTKRDQSALQLEVRDTGEGIAAAFLPHVFDRFRQQDATSSRRHGGVGLGLAIVRHLVELQGGEVQAESAGEGQGATFRAIFPVMRARDAGRSVVSTASDWRARRLDGLRVMAIDDEPDTLEMIRAVLERCSAQVRTATSALDGLREIGQWKPDVVVADIGMPDHDGFWLIRHVRDLGPEAGGAVPAIALTAFARAEDRLRALSEGFQMHVAKPVSPAELVAVIHSLGRVRA